MFSYCHSFIEEKNLEPLFEGYQLIGDSQFLRFAEQLLCSQRRKKDGRLCVSGQRTYDLLRRIKSNFHPVAPKVVLMIGTNDILQNTNLSNLKQCYTDLLLELLRRYVQKLIILTVPPVPRLAKSRNHWYLVQELNKHIKSADNGKEVIVLDSYDKFIRKNELSGSFSSLNSLPSFQNSLISNSSNISSPIFSPFTELRISFQFSSPNPKQKLFESSLLITDDDHDDRLDDNDCSSEEYEEIKTEYFEQFFVGKEAKEDKIHLNYKGLRLIRKLILDEIQE